MDTSAFVLYLRLVWSRKRRVMDLICFITRFGFAVAAAVDICLSVVAVHFADSLLLIVVCRKLLFACRCCCYWQCLLVCGRVRIVASWQTQLAVGAAWHGGIWVSVASELASPLLVSDDWW